MEKKHKIILFSVIFVLIILILFGIFFPKNKVIECEIDSDCIPDSCCHSQSCANKSYVLNCTGVFCSAVCSGPLDCGAGQCGCVKNKCEVVANE
jgi:Na+-transporting NADH:ubiquinone oxidoreductase subunit NqrF